MIDITGQKFGRLTAIKFHHKKGKRQYWEFECSCGNKKVIIKSNVVRGTTRSCGCLFLEMLKNTPRGYKHKMSGTRFYRIFQCSKSRCNNKNNRSYNDYGARGIKFLWNSFEDFKKDMYPSYQKHIKKYGEENTTLDRIDVNGNYCKENCRWVTWQEQSNNTRKTLYLTYKNQTKTLKDWAKYTKIPYGRILFRFKNNWSPDKILSTNNFYYDRHTKKIIEIICLNTNISFIGLKIIY